jgi:hypothetical protein
VHAPVALRQFIAIFVSYKHFGYIALYTLNTIQHLNIKMVKGCIKVELRAAQMVNI